MSFILPVYVSYKLITMILAAAPAMLSEAPPDPQSYYMMDIYPMEIASEAEAALYTERLLKPIMEFFDSDDSPASEYQPVGVSFYNTLCDMDTAWFSTICQWMQCSPAEAAASLGLPQSAVLGSYDPENELHDPDQPQTWLIPSWEKLHLSIQDGNGTAISPSSNTKEILSMASIYIGCVNREDTELFRNYITTLWQVSHHFHVEIGPVSFCEGCKTANEVPDTYSAEQAQEDSYCPGHVDLTITAQIYGLDGKISLYSMDAAGTQRSELWAGWTEENQAAVRRLSQEDWYHRYGLEPYEPCVGTPLKAEQIREYLTQLPDDLSPERKLLIETALNSVGKIPYYYGGKTGSPGYENNHFGSPISPDKKGRNLSGLDCSGWISWVYLTATGAPAAQGSTQSLANGGQAVSVSQLKPGDIVVQIGNAGEDEDDNVSSHAAMFLSWNADGTMNIIHETGMPVNNVSVSTVSADWPYMRAFLE